jgi:hypothetical protein
VATQPNVTQPAYASSSRTFSGCHSVDSKGSAEHLAVAWECLCAYDTLLFALTLSRACMEARERQRNAPPGFPTIETTYDLVAVITRDGVLYYSVVTLASIANVLTFYVAQPLLKGVLSNPTGALSTALCARLMLNLRASAAEDWLRVRIDFPPSRAYGERGEAVVPPHAGRSRYRRHSSEQVELTILPPQSSEERG